MSQEFINQIKGHALKSQAKTGVPAAIIIAQACLETGYGKFLCKDIITGKNSLNLFNIKGDGPNGFVWCWTTEYYNGVKQKVKAKFRAYRNYEESFIDHAKLLQKPRYAPCMVVKDDPIAFAQKLQECGYATDPNYADKLIRVMKTFNLLNLKPEGGTDMKPEDAQKIVDIMGATYTLAKAAGMVQAQLNEIHRLTDEVRKAGGLSIA